MGISLKIHRNIGIVYFITLFFFPSLFGICGQRRTKLDESQRFFQFLADSEEEEAWLIEKTRLVKSNETGNDLAHVMRLLNKHDVRVDTTGGGGG